MWNRSDGDYAFDADNNYLFLNSNISRIENILQNVVEDDNVPFGQDELFQLFKAKDNSNKLITSDEVARMQKKIEALERENNEIKSAQFVDEGRYVQKGGLSLEEQKAHNLEARRMVKQILSQYEEFDCSDWNPEEDTPIVLKKVRKNGELIDIVIASAKSSPVHLSPYAFNVLASNPDNQLFVRDRQGVHNVTFNDIFLENQSVNMVFDTNYVPNTVLAQLAQVFNYVSNTKFVIENPHFSANSMLSGFGLKNLISGKAFVPSDEDQW